MRIAIVALAMLSALAFPLSDEVHAQGTRPKPHETPAAAPETIELAAGGLVFVPDETTRIEAEEVVLGHASVTATYWIRNGSSDRIVRDIAWPLPEIDRNHIGDDTVALPSPDPVNPVGGSVTVDGVPVALSFEQRATAFARDVTVLLQGLGLPLNPMAAGIDEVIRRISGAELSELEIRGIITRDDDRVIPNWSVRTTAVWRQPFEPGKVLAIRLSYTPIAASGPLHSDAIQALKEAYCIDRRFEEAAAARLAKSSRGLTMHRLTYAMGHEPGWWTPVPSFRLALEKSGLETLVASCWSELRSVGPTRLEAVHRDFKPSGDVRVLFVN